MAAWKKPSVTQVLRFCYRAIQFAKMPDATEADKMVCTCISCYAGMIKMIKGSRQIFSREEADIFKELKLRHLRSYTWMHKRGLTLSHRLPPFAICFCQRCMSSGTSAKTCTRQGSAQRPRSY